jgi:UDP-N-acetylglucosamine--N-acetylmuramyl-(pentapeptide) pyrophosphoryl-undecaprenol N-acetylglucosamine transferase
MIAEITAVGLPAIFIPSPYVADNHQEHNAQAIAQSGAGIIIRERELKGRRLLNEVLGLLRDAPRLEAMHKSALALGKPKAAEQICLALESLIRHKK